MVFKGSYAANITEATKRHVTFIQKNIICVQVYYMLHKESNRMVVVSHC